jgi:hypothetical protein
MQKKCQESVDKFETFEYKRKKQIEEFDRDYKDKFSPEKFKSKYKWVEIKTKNKDLEDKLKESVVIKVLSGKKQRSNSKNASILSPDPNRLLSSGWTLNSYIEKTFEEFKELYLQQPVQKRVKRRSKSQEVSPEFQESVLEEGENTKKPKSKELSEL